MSGFFTAPVVDADADGPLRKIERGAISSPAFFTVAALARVLDLDLDLATLARTLMPEETTQHHQEAS